MRLTDHRYSQQRDRLEIALRMIRHQARTSTIRECTGISEDRIRKLHGEYQCASSLHARRKRGKSPQQLYCLSHNLQARTDATLMAGVYQSSGVLDAARKDRNFKIDIRTAARICDAYELFVALRPTIQKNEFSFEHAWLLIRALYKGEEIAPTTCPQCASLMLQDLYAPPRAMCPICEIKRLAEPKRRSRKRARDRTQPVVGRSI